MKFAVIFADGTEEIEALTPVDVLRRCNGVSCDIISVSGNQPKGSHGIIVNSDLVVEEACFDAYDAIIVPGGMPGAVTIAKTQKVIEAIKAFYNSGKLIAAICASPAVVFAPLGILNGKKVTCYPAPDFVSALKSANYTANPVEQDGNVITANGPKSAMAFALEICSYFNLQPKF